MGGRGGEGRKAVVHREVTSGSQVRAVLCLSPAKRVWTAHVGHVDEFVIIIIIISIIIIHVFRPRSLQERLGHDVHAHF